MIESYFKKTAPYQSKRFKIEEVAIQSILKIKRDQEQDRSYVKDVDNKMLLWCGVRFTDVVKVLRHGFLPLANLPENLNKSVSDVKFSDMVSNSLTYCNSTPENNVAFLFLCEVALGEIMRVDGQNTEACMK